MTCVECKAECELILGTSHSCPNCGRLYEYLGETDVYASIIEFGTGFVVILCRNGRVLTEIGILNEYQRSIYERS